MTQTIYDEYNWILGYVETDSKGNKTAMDFHHRILGYYQADLNVTTDFHHRVIARGDAVVGLIYAEHEKFKAEHGGRGY